MWWRTLMCSGILAIAGLVTPCSGPQCDVDRVVVEFSGEGATNCGAVEGWDENQLFIAARDCIVDATTTGKPFFATVDLPVSDGRILVGYSSDGAAIRRTDYSYAVNQLAGAGPERIAASTCRALVSRGATCDSLRVDLCLTCEAPRDVAVAACR